MREILERVPLKGLEPSGVEISKANITSSNDIYKNQDTVWDQRYYWNSVDKDLVSDECIEEHEEELAKEVEEFEDTPMEDFIDSEDGYTIYRRPALADIYKQLKTVDLQWLFGIVLKKIKISAMHRGEIIRSTVYFTNEELQIITNKYWPHLFIRRFIVEEFSKILGLKIKDDMFFEEARIRLPENKIVLDVSLNMDFNWEELIEEWDKLPAEERNWAKIEKIENDVSYNRKSNLCLSLYLSKLKEQITTSAGLVALDKLLTAIKEQAFDKKGKLKTDVIGLGKDGDNEWYYRGIDELMKIRITLDMINLENTPCTPTISYGEITMKGKSWASVEPNKFLKELDAKSSYQWVRIALAVNWPDLIAQYEAETTSEAI